MNQHQTIVVAKSLMQALKFTEEDLTANRAGRLTPSQQKWLRQRIIIWSGYLMIPAPLVLLICVSLVLSPFPSQFNIMELVGYSGAGFLLLIASVATLRILAIMRQHWLDMRQKQVAAACGYFSLFIRRHTQGRRTYHLKIQGVDLTIIPGLQGYNELEGLLTNDQAITSYCVYYAPHTKLMLSLHPETFPGEL